MASTGLMEKLRSAFRRWSALPPPIPDLTPAPVIPKIGLALGGGFARGVAHVGVLKVFERENIPIHCIAGVSAGAIVAAAYASGADVDEIAKVGCAMRFADVARWSICRLGLMGSERMAAFLKRLLKEVRFEDMKIPLGVLATDVATGEPAVFYEHGDVILPIRASCSYPGLFQPIRYQDRLLVDGAMSVEVPALLARTMGATHVISVALPMQRPEVVPSNMMQVVNRCFQILQHRAEDTWRRHSDLIISPDVAGVEWDGFKSGIEMIRAGELAAEAALPQIKKWLGPARSSARGLEPLPTEQLAS
ncbi:MAG: patatin-like phospholipase family protein [Acidobacteriia bacterium]|nr:patatin-like phospholipase family protein [Terriglobia bacterium]